MKLIQSSVAVACGVMVLGAAVQAQEFRFRAPEERERAERRAPAVVVAEREPVDGILPRLVSASGGIQMLNPGAPKEFGDGQNTVSVDPNDPKRKPKGFILLSFNW